MNNNKGVSIITLIITIVVIVILASFALNQDLVKNSDKAVETKTVYEVHEVIEAVASRSMLNNLNSSYYKLIGKTTFEDVEITYDGSTKVYKGSDGWYRVNEASEFMELGLNNTEGDYLVNYVTGAVVSVNGVKYKDKVYHSFNDLKQEMGGGTTILSKVEYDSSKGVNKPVLSTGMVPVKLSGGKWVVTSADDEAWYDYSADQKAWANVMLMDELTVSGYDNATLKSTPISELVGKEVITEGSAYVWIPRYTSATTAGSGSKIIFSNLTNDTTSANGETYTTPAAFTYGSGADALDLTGIWVSKYEAGFNE